MDITECDVLSNKIEIDLDVFGALVLHWVRQERNGIEGYKSNNREGFNDDCNALDGEREKASTTHDAGADEAGVRKKTHASMQKLDGDAEGHTSNNKEGFDGGCSVLNGKREIARVAHGG